MNLLDEVLASYGGANRWQQINAIKIHQMVGGALWPLKGVDSVINDSTVDIAAEVASLSPGSNPLLSKFTRGTRVYPLIETLGSTTDLAELDAMATLPEDAEADRERLESEVAALRSNSFDALVANAQETERHLTRLHSVLTSVTSFDEDAYEAASAGLERAERRRAEA